MDFTKYKNPGYKNVTTSQSVYGNTLHVPKNIKKRRSICHQLFSYFIYVYNKYV